MLTEKERKTHAESQAYRKNEEDLSERRYGAIAKIYENIFKDKVIADLGCGYGWGIRDVLSKYTKKKIIGFDVNKESVRIAEKEIKQLKNVELRNSFIWDTGYPDKYFDMITCIETIEHIDEEEITLTIKEMYRLLKLGGLVYLTTPEKRPHQFPSGSHWMEYTMEEMKKMFKEHNFRLKYFLPKPTVDNGVSNGYVFEKVGIA